MTALIIIAAIVLFFALLFSLFAGIRITYTDEVAFAVTVGPFSFTPGKKKKPPKHKKEKKKKKKKKKEEAPAAAGQAPPEDEKQKKREKRESLFDLVRAVKKVLPRFFGRLHFKSAKLFAKVATGDAASTAIACGGAKAAASLLFETIDNFSVLDRGSEKNVSIEPDFTGCESKFDVDLRFKIRIGSALLCGLKFLKEFIKLKIKRERKKS